MKEEQSVIEIDDDCVDDEEDSESEFVMGFEVSGGEEESEGDGLKQKELIFYTVLEEAKKRKERVDEKILKLKEEEERIESDYKKGVTGDALIDRENERKYTKERKRLDNERKMLESKKKKCEEMVKEETEKERLKKERKRERKKKRLEERIRQEKEKKRLDLSRLN